jgi:membrane-associated phospholipid phosphatase
MYWPPVGLAAGRSATISPVKGITALLALAAVAFVGLALAYEREPLASLDQDVADWVAEELSTAVEWAARPFSWLGGWIGLTLLGAVATALLIRERAWLDLAFLLVAYAGSQLAVALFKETFERPRPDVGSAFPLPGSFAFPSGHAAAGAASIGALAVLASERLPSSLARTWLWVGVVLLGAGVGLSRIALNVHFVTDVLAGWCLGLAWLAACLLLRDALRRRDVPG